MGLLSVSKRKLVVDVNFDDPTDAVLALASVTSTLMYSNLDDYQDWSNLYSLLEGNQGGRKIVGRVKIAKIGA